MATKRMGYCQATQYPTQDHAQWLQNEWDTAKQHNTQLQEHAQWLQNEWDTAKQHNTQLQERVQRLQNELNAANAKVDELNHSAHHWWMMADQLNKEQQSIYASKFWRITWPLRKIMQTAKWSLALPARTMRWAIRSAQANNQAPDEVVHAQDPQ